MFKTFLRSRVWFNIFWWASYCSMHRNYDPKCKMCQGGSWADNWDPSWD